MKTLINNVINKLGYTILKKENNPSYYLEYGQNLHYDYNKEAKGSIKIVRNFSMLPYVNLLSLFEQTVYCEKTKIEGDFVECGVWKGGAVGLMALANLEFGLNRRNLHLFDSFDSICYPDENIDGDKAIEDVIKFAGDYNKEMSGLLKPIQGFYTSLGGPGTIQSNKQLLEGIIKYPQEYISYYKGWFQNTIPENYFKIQKISILRLDCDWYASTKICLDYLYDKVVSGGIIIVDDYGCYEGCKKAVDEFLEKRSIKTFLNYSNENCRYWIKK